MIRLKIISSANRDISYNRTRNLSTPFFKKTQKFLLILHKSTVWPFTMRHVRFRPPLPIYMLFHSKRTVFLMQCRLRTMFRHRAHFLQYKASVIVCITFICRSCTVLCTESALFCVDTVYFGRYNTIVKAPKLFYRNPSCRSRRKPHPPAFVPLCPLCSRKTQ